MATRTLTIIMICCAGAVAGVAGWQAGDELFTGTQESEASVPGHASVLVKSLPVANREVKRDRADMQTPPDQQPLLPSSLPSSLQSSLQPTLRMSLADSPLPQAMPPPMVPRAPARMDKPSRAYLNDAQLAGIRQRLRLTRAQEKYWQPVEAALRSLSPQIADFQKRMQRRDYTFDLESAEIQQLKAAAVPFLAQLRDDQKNQVRMLANMAGVGGIVTALVEPEAAKDEAKTGN